MCRAQRKLAFYRRPLATLLALAYLTAMVGVPWPGSAIGDGTPFPCQGHRCGCRSAAECWNHCCCFTAAQRLAWAAARGIEPPAELVAAAADDHDHSSGHEDQCEAADSQLAEIRSADSHLAEQAPAHRCCHCGAGGQAVAHGAQEQDEQTNGSATMAKTPTAPDKTSEHGLRAFHCHGIATLWVTSGAVAPSVPPVGWSFDWCLMGTIAPLGCSLSAVASLPAVPPPRA